VDLTKDYSLTLTGAEVNYIGQLLASRPYSEVFQVIPKIQAQVEAQNIVKPENTPAES
jgi:hypothetical protein